MLKTHLERIGEHVVVVPLRSFHTAKSRLRVAGAAQVSLIAEMLATGVVRNCAPLPVVVVCEHDDVQRFALANGACVLRSPHTGLNEAVSFAYEQLGPHCDRVTIVHGDLRQPEGLGLFEPGRTISIITDRDGTGTNVLSLPTGLEFQFHYGPHSALRHTEEAARLDVDFETITDSPWGFDVDVPADLSTN